MSIWHHIAVHPPLLNVGTPVLYISWWRVKNHLLEGMPIGAPTPDLRLYSDASR